MPNLPFGSVSCTGVSPHRLTWLASAPFRARHPPVSGRLSTTPPRRGNGTPAVVSRCLSAAGLRFPAILSRLVFRPSYDRPTGSDAPDHDGVSTFRTREMRPERAPSLSRDRRCSRRPGAIPGPPPAASQRHGPLPRPHDRHLSGAMPHETSVKGSRHSPARPSPHLWPPDDSGALGLLPWAPHPHGQDPRTHARAGTGSEH